MYYTSIKSPGAPTDLIGFDSVSGTVSRFDRDGSTFILDQTLAGGFAGYSIDVGDVDGDGRDDLVLWNATKITILFNDGNDSFARVDLYDAATSILDLSLGDFDGDGVAELLVATAISAGPQVWNADRTGYVALPARNPSGFGTAGWITGDFNGDDRADAFTYRYGFSGADMWLSTGSALNYSSIWTPAAPVGMNWLTGDFNGDGRADIVDASGRLLLSSGTAFVDAGRASVGDSTVVAVDDFDGDGGADLVLRGADGQLSWLGNPLVGATSPMVVVDQSNGQPTLSFLGDVVAVSVASAGTNMSYRFSLVTQGGTSVVGIWSDLPEAHFPIDAAGLIGVMLEIRDNASGELTSRQYAADPITVRDPAVVEQLLDLGRFTIAEYGGDISLAASQQGWRAAVASFDDLFDHAASVVAAGGGASPEFSASMAQATGFLQFVSGLWGLGEFDGSGGGVMANSVLGTTLPQDASIDTYLDSPIGLCTDYAAILALFLTKASFENRVISGAGHIFNEVQIDGQWWVFDAMVGMALKGTLDDVLDMTNPVDVMVFENAQSDPTSSVFRPGNTDSFYLLNWYHNSVSPDNLRYSPIDFLFSLPYGDVFEPALDLSAWTPTAPTALSSHGHPDGMGLGEFVSIISRQRLELVLIDTDVSAIASGSGWRQGVNSFGSFAAQVDALLTAHFGVAQASEVPMADRARFYAQFVSGLWSLDTVPSSASSWTDLLAGQSAGAGDFIAALTGLLMNAGLSPVIRTTANGFVAEVQIGEEIFAFDPVTAMNFLGGWNRAADTTQLANIETYHSANLQGGQSAYSANAASLRYDLLSLLAGGLISPSQAIDGLAFLAGTIFGSELGVIEALDDEGAARILAIAPDRAVNAFIGAVSIVFDVTVSEAGIALTAADFLVSGAAGMITSIVALDPLTWRITVVPQDGGVFASAPWLAPSVAGQLGTLQVPESGSDGALGMPTIDRNLFQGGSGIDTVDFSGAWQSPIGVDVDLTTGLGKNGFAEGDIFSSIEILIGTDRGDRLRGSAGDDILIGGGGGGDILIGEGGNDQLLAGDGNDRLVGGAGADLLDGGADVDTADYRGNYGGVWIDLAAGTGKWNWAHGDVLVGIENVIGTSYDDWLYGSTDANRLDGGEGNDRLFGGGGNDVLVSGAGADLLDGGAGEDTADYSGNYGGVWIDLAAGTGKWNWAHGDVLVGIENVIGTNYDDWLYGSAGKKKLYGGGGDDRLVGGAGADLLDGGTGEDTADYRGNYGGVWIDLAAGAGKWNWAHGDVLVGIENVIGTNYDDWLYGSTDANRLDGGEGNDRLFGGGGNDGLVGGAGADLLDGGAGEDTADYSGNYGGVWIDLAVGTGKWNWAHGDVLVGIENVIGTNYDDWLYGSTDANRLDGGEGNDRLFGGGGNDVLVGGASADLLDGGAGEDTADYSGNFGGVWIDLAAGTGKWNWAHGDVLVGIENVVGTSYNDWLYGSAGENKLYGGDGDDILSGGGGNDLIDGGGGNDVALFSGSQQDYSIDIQSGQAVITDLRSGSSDGQDILRGIETIRFGDGTEMSLSGTSALANDGVARAALDGAYEIALIRIASDVAGFGGSASDLLPSSDIESGQTHSSLGMYHF